MPDNGHDIPWTEQQWATVQRTVLEAANKARVASSFLPLVGPLPLGQATVPRLLLAAWPILPAESLQRGEAENRIQIDDGETLTLTTIACNVYLTTLEAEDPDLAAALQMLCRAASLLGRLEDAIVFNGPLPDPRPEPLPPPWPQPEIYTIHGQPPPGLAFPPPEAAWEVPVPGPPVDGEDLVECVVVAIRALERDGQFGPFACVLGDDLYRAANTANFFMVLPSDRIVPFLGGGPLLRSGALPDDLGVIVALAGGPIDLVVASDVHVTYVQRSVEPRYILCVSERFVLRVKQPEAICVLAVGP